MNHYVYLIEHKNPLPGQPVQYIGVRSCECNVGDDEYMSSSKYVKEAIEKYGKDQFNKIILKRFDSRKGALNYEIELHKEFDVGNNTFFFNKVKQTSIKFAAADGKNNHFYGKKHTEESRKLMSEVLKTKDCRQKKTRKGEKHTPEAKAKLSLSMKEYYKTHRSPRFGIKMSDATKLRVHIGTVNQTRYKCAHCNIVTTPGNIKRWHNDVCKKRKVEA